MTGRDLVSKKNPAQIIPVSSFSWEQV